MIFLCFLLLDLAFAAGGRGAMGMGSPVVLVSNLNEEVQSYKYWKGFVVYFLTFVMDALHIFRTNVSVFPLSLHNILPCSKGHLDISIT